MRAVVSFRSGGQHYAVAVERVQRVLGASGLVPLPNPQSGVAGLLRHGRDTVTVLSPLGAERGQVLVLDHGGTAVGLLVDEVTGIDRVEDPAVGPAPAGQRSPLVSGVLNRKPEGEDGPDGLLLLLDLDVLVERLHG